jgi:superfamily I DNA and/or RNA helicase
MHSGLLDFPNSQFYKGIIRFGSKDEDRMMEVRVQHPNGLARCMRPNFPSMFIQVTGKETYQESSKSYSNQPEANMVSNVVGQLCMEYRIKYTQIGIITPYSAQQILLQKELLQRYPELEISSVDGFQGRQKEIIIFSAVRANDECKIGFLYDKRRLNVSMTRARRMFIVVANGETLCAKPGMWSDMWNFYASRQAIFDGPTVQLLKPMQAEKKGTNKAEKKDGKDDK